MSDPTVNYVNVYREKDGSVSFGIITNKPETAASYVYLCDGIPISLLRFTFDSTKPFGERLTATEIRQ